MTSMPRLRRFRRFSLGLRWLCAATALGLAAPDASAEPDEIAALIEDADTARDGERWLEAARHLEAALTLSLAAEPLDGDQIDEILADLVRSYFAAGIYRKALEHQRLVLERALERDDPLDSADAALNAAVLAARLRNWKEADRQLAFAEVLFTESGTMEALAKIAHYQGIVAQGRADYAQCVAKYERSRALYLGRGNGTEAARRLLDLGNVYKESLNDYPKALALYDAAIAEFEALERPDLALATRIDKGNTLVELGELKLATDLLSRTLVKIPVSSDAVSWIRAAQMLAKAHFRAGAFHNAERLVARIVTRLPDVANGGQRASLEIDAINLQAMIDAELGRTEAAYKTFGDAIRMAQSLGLSSKEAFLRNNLGYWLRESGRVSESIAEHNLALEIDRRLGTPEGIAFDLRNIGLGRLAAGDLDAAVANLTEALDLSSRVGGAYNLAYTHLGLGEARLAQGNWAAALPHFKRAVDLADQYGIKGFAWQAHTGLAQAAWKRGETALAEKHFLQAMGLVESVESGLQSEEARRGFKTSEKVQATYRAYGELLRQTNRPREADAVSRRARPRTASVVPTM
jgi:tetratricopeptide (TPR) repeat protein